MHHHNIMPVDDSDVTSPRIMEVVYASLAMVQCVFEKAKIPFWLEYGSLLGAMGSGAILDNDNYISIGVFANHRKQVEALVSCIFAAGYELTPLSHAQFQVRPLDGTTKYGSILDIHFFPTERIGVDALTMVSFGKLTVPIPSEQHTLAIIRGIYPKWRTNSLY